MVLGGGEWWLLVVVSMAMMVVVGVAVFWIMFDGCGGG